MSDQFQFLFPILVFVAVTLFSCAIFIPTVSQGASQKRKYRRFFSRTLLEDRRSIDSLVRNELPKNKTDNENEKIRNRAGAFLEKQISSADSKLSVSTLSFIILGSGNIALCLALLVTKNALILLGVFALGAWLPLFRLKSLAKKRLQKFDEQLPVALDIISRALKAGHPFNDTLHFVSSELEDPLASEFERVSSDISYGMPSKKAFQSLLERVPSSSLQTLVTAVLIQQETGGALAEILENVSEVIRGRFKLQRKLKTLSAEGRMSAAILTLLPFFLAGLLSFASPGYLPVLFHDPLGQKIIAAGLFLIGVGFLWIKWIISIKV